MIDCTPFTQILIEEFNKTPGTSAVEVRCSLPAEELTVGVLDLIQAEIDKILFEEDLVVTQITFAKDSQDPGSKDFFVKISKI